MRGTEKDYVNYLNQFAPDYDSEKWIMQGKRQEHHAIRKMYGQALRLYDPIAFQAGYNEWEREQKNNY